MIVSTSILAFVPGRSDAAAIFASPWTVDESLAPLIGLYPPTFIPQPIAADNMTYGYASRITLSNGRTRFHELGYFDMRDFYTGFIPGVQPGTAVPSGMSSGYYRLRGEFEISGPITAAGVMIETGVASFYIDLTPNNSSWDRDILLGSAAHLASGSAGGTTGDDFIGNFDALYDDFTLTADGQAYFNSPQPFSSNLYFSGLIHSWTPGDLLETYDTLGVGIAYVSVPEPTALICAPVAFTGFTLRRRRRRG